MPTLKGQNFRVYVGSSVVAQATSCSVTLTNNVEDSGSKDDTGGAQKPVNVTKSWQVQVDSMDVSDIKTMLTAIKNGTAFTVKWDKTAGASNAVRQYADYNRSGSAYLTDATFIFENRKVSTKSLTFSGTGALSKETNN